MKRLRIIYNAHHFAEQNTTLCQTLYLPARLGDIIMRTAYFYYQILIYVYKKRLKNIGSIGRFLPIPILRKRVRTTDTDTSVHLY